MTLGSFVLNYSQFYGVSKPKFTIFTFNMNCQRHNYS